MLIKKTCIWFQKSRLGTLKSRLDFLLKRLVTSMSRLGVEDFGRDSSGGYAPLFHNF